MELSWNPNTKCTEKPQSSVSTHPLLRCSLFFKKYLNRQVRTDKLVTTLVLVLQYYPQWYILSHFFKLLKVLSLSRMLVEFTLTCMFNHLEEQLFNFMVFTFLENALNLWIYSWPNSPIKTPGRTFLKSVSPKTNTVEETI